MELIKITEENGIKWASAKNLQSLGYKINPFASMHSHNKPVFDESGDMIDVFIPFHEIYSHTYKVSDTPPAKKHFKTYLFQDKNSGNIKIGRALDVSKRFTTLSIGNPDLKIILIIDNDVERELHNHFDLQRISGEWFKLSNDDLEDIKTKYLK